MEFISRITEITEPDKIVEELLNGQSGSFDLGIVFITPNYPYDPKSIIEGIRKKIQIRHFLACTCAGIIGSSKELEDKPAVSILLARLPDVKIAPFYLTQQDVEGFKTKEELYDFFEVYPNERPVFLVLPDPFLIDAAQFLDGVNQAYPECSVVGGMASASGQPRGNMLYVDDRYTDEGLIGLVLTGNITIDTVVSQGCRPIGETYIATKTEGNVIYELAGRTFYQVLQEVLEKATPRDRQLAGEAVFIGIAMNEYAHAYKRGDFLIRGVLGVDPQSGAGVVADYVGVGQTIQFHLRDAQTAQEDLHELLRVHEQKHNEKPKGALVFSCNGRGQNLFRVQDHDIKIIQQHLGGIPAAGFFCAGEIGPIGGKNFLHGFTNSMALFYPKSGQSEVHVP